MSERTSYAPGAPSWVDLATPDIEAAARFYGEVFGWEVPERPNSPEMGGYRRAIKNGKDVAGMMPMMDRGQEGQPPAWTTYVSVADADATAAAVKDAGGSVMAGPMDVMDLGRMAVFTDPEGAFFGIWQPGTFSGAELVNEAGTFGWNELGTRDPAAAKQFYGAVFAWGYDEEPSDRVGTYTIAKVGEEMAAGMINLDSLEMPAEVPASWLAYFMVDDADATVDKIRSGGGGVMNGPMDIPPGRFAVVADPFGAAFAVMQPNEES